MKKAYAILILLFLFGLIINAVEKPIVENGRIDLSNWSFDNNGNISLNGNWEFYWGRFLEPKDFESGDVQGVEYENVPNSWKNYKNKYPSFGYATFRVVVNSPAKTKTLALRIKNAGSTYKVFVNGRMLSECGKVGKTEEEEVPVSSERIVCFENTSEKIDVIIQVSNFTFANAGLWTRIEIGNVNDINRDVNRENLKESFIIGTLVIMGLYHIWLFALRKKEFAVLCFGLFCLATAGRSLFASVGFYSLFPESVNFQWKSRIELIAYFLSGIFFIVYIGYTYRKEFSKYVIRGAYVMGIGFTILQLMYPLYIMDRYLLVYYHIWIMTSGFYMVYVIIKAFRNKREGSSYMVVFISIFLACVLNDILNGLSIIHTAYYVPLGLFVFIFGQSIIIASRFSNAVNVKDALTHELANSNNELKNTVAKLEQSQEHLIRSEKLAVIGMLSGNITHEIKNPLGAIMTNIQSMRMDLGEAEITPPEIKESLIDSAEIIELASKQARNIITNMLDYSRMDKEEMYKMDLNKVVNASILLMKKELTNLKISVEFKTESKEIVIMGNSGEITQVILNILINARDALIEKNAPDKKIKIYTYEKNDKAILEIEDTGTGIAKENMDKIFEIYYTTKEKGKGTGIGMSVVKSIVEKHNGVMEIESEVGEYTKFRFIF